MSSHLRSAKDKIVLNSCNYINFTMQSMQIAFELTSSMNTLAGCISSSAIRSEM